MLWLSKSKVIIEHVIVVSEQKGKESWMETGRFVGHIVLLFSFSHVQTRHFQDLFNNQGHCESKERLYSYVDKVNNM